MGSIHDAFVGAADEVSYGNTVAPSDFFEFTEEGVSGSYERIQSEGMRAGAKVLRSDRWVPNPKGAGGDLTMEVLDQGFDFWLKHMLGAVATGTPALGVTPYTATLGPIDGQSFSQQIARPDSNGVVQPFTYSGGKVAEWELSNETDGVLMLTLSQDFASEHVPDGTESGALVLATPTYPVGAKLLTFVKGTVQVGGTDFAVTNVSLKGNNGLKVDRYGMRGANSTTKREPREEAMREYSLALTGEFEDTTHIQRVAAAIASDAHATVSLLWEGVAVAGGGIPSLEVTIPTARFDEGPVNVGGSEMIEQALKAMVLDEDLQIVYTASA
jgi:hypothetical protein